MALVPDTLIGALPLWESRLYLATLVAILAWELIAPLRAGTDKPSRRLLTNFGLWLVNVLVARLLPLASAVGLAIWARDAGFGLFNLDRFRLPLPAAIVAAVLVLDLAVYWVHRLLHWQALGWRLHRVHHSDIDFDVTTGLRNHPLEALLVPFLMLPVTLLIGAPPEALALSGLAMAVMDSFTHANIGLPPVIERPLRWLLVTPAMHRIHHSAEQRETDSNFGMFLSFWDRLFGTYVAQPAGGHLAMRVGLAEFRTAQDGRLDQMLMNPLRPNRPAA